MLDLCGDGIGILLDPISSNKDHISEGLVKGDRVKSEKAVLYIHVDQTDRKSEKICAIPTGLSLIHCHGPRPSVHYDYLH
jgi:hypothetical protein